MLLEVSAWSKTFCWKFTLKLTNLIKGKLFLSLFLFFKLNIYIYATYIIGCTEDSTKSIWWQQSYCSYGSRGSCLCFICQWIQHWRFWSRKVFLALIFFQILSIGKRQLICFLYFLIYIWWTEYCWMSIVNHPNYVWHKYR